MDAPRLRRVLGDPALDWLVQRVRRRIANGEALTGSVSLPQATTEQREAARRLLGRAPRPGRSLTVSLPAVDRVLRASEMCPGGLAEAVVALHGPVERRGASRQAEERAWRDAFTRLDPVCAERPELLEYAERLRATGLVRRLVAGPEQGAALLGDLAAVVAHLPAPGTALGTFAARVLGDAHALDDDRPLATLALGAARALTRFPDGEGAQWRREAWAAAGLLKDELTATVLTLGLPGDDRGATGRALAALRAAGQPAVLTLRQVVGDPPAPPPAGTLVSVCENPAVVSAAAERLGGACPPLVCTQGQPTGAALALLRAMVEAGARLRYHGDFDWGGIRIGNALRRRVAWEPWRFTTADYRDAVGTVRAVHPAPLHGARVDAEWDAALSAALAEAGLRVEEELVLEDLLADLGAG